MKVLVTMVILLACIGCNSQPKDFVIYKKGEVMPDIVVQHESLIPAADYLNSLFGKAYGDKLSIVKKQGNGVAIQLGLIKKSKDKSHFTVTADTKSVKIKGTTPEEVQNGIRYFFREYAGVHYISGKGIVSSASKIITVPHDLSYTHTYDFEYREPYFPDNYDVEFRKWYGTHTMEDTWSVWGHNLSKVIEPSAQMMARVNGEINEEQFCFSSPELEEALTSYIKTMAVDEPLRSKFMVLANDNYIVCQCDRCKAVGNTHNNASPAVFTLINKLAAKFSKQQFFSTAYITTQHPPKFKLAANAGVMVSTMAFPKGVIIEQSGKKPMIDKTFADWEKVTGTIYLWDYAINFDNYFKAYPTLLIAQANLKYYKKQGVTGVFMQGSEDQYSAYADLKNYLYALLLQNPDIDVKKETAAFFKAKYPAVADLLTDYYLTIEQRSFDKKIPLDIYGGMLQSKKKYLDEDSFNTFYDALYRKAETLSDTEIKDLKPLLLSLTFIKLELLRTNGVGANGYKNSPDAATSPEVDVLFRRLWELSSQTGVTTFSETGALIADYLKEWNSEIINRPYRNLLFGKKLKLDFTPDEEYPNAAVLTDGAVGFSDYYNNWMICTGEAFAVTISAQEVKGANTLEMDFLQDTRHNIYPPEKVEVIIGDRKYEAKVVINADKKVSKRRVSIAIDILPADTAIHIKTVKSPDYKTKAMACDEIVFKK